MVLLSPETEGHLHSLKCQAPFIMKNNQNLKSFNIMLEKIKKSTLGAFHKLRNLYSDITMTKFISIESFKKVVLGLWLLWLLWMLWSGLLRF